MSNDTKTIHAIISGRVQGVGYRAWFSANARKRGLNGWVRNVRDGSVEAVLSGSQTVVDSFIESCWDGPLISRVQFINVTPYHHDVAQGFQQKETAPEPLQAVS